MEQSKVVDLRKVWDVELDLFEKFKSICEKYNLTYCACSGTLLGAVRHKGFIPWDDDMDLFLPWQDYVKFMEVAPKECQYPYCFQSFLTDKDGEISANRMRRSDTTGLTQWESENITDKDYDRGIFIDRGVVRKAGAGNLQLAFFIERGMIRDAAGGDCDHAEIDRVAFGRGVIRGAAAVDVEPAGGVDRGAARDAAGEGQRA